MGFLSVIIHMKVFKKKRIYTYTIHRTREVVSQDCSDFFRKIGQNSGIRKRKEENHTNQG